MRYYSKATGCTYLDDIHTQMPPDAIPIADERFFAVIANPAEGKIRSHDSDGLPILIDPTPPSSAELANASYATRTKSINQACEAAITAGFMSDALGAPHFYSSQLDDQLNLTGAVLRGLDMPYACRDEQGVKEFRLHTAEQLRQVGDDFTLYKLQLLQHANALKQQLDAALDDGDLVALEAISWEAPQP